MTVSYFVIYQGQAEDPEAFRKHYRETHVPILRTWPGIQGITLHTPVCWSDSEPVRTSEFALLSQMTFADGEALESALHSAQRAAAREDFERFPRFVGDVFHQAVLSERMA